MTDPWNKIKNSALKQKLFLLDESAKAQGMELSRLIEELRDRLVTAAQQTKPQPAYKPRRTKGNE